MERTDQTGERTTRPAPGRGGFTLTEMMFTIAVIFLLMALLVVGLRIAAKTANKAAEEHAVAALILGCEQFKLDFNFPPPLIEDFNPKNGDDDIFTVGVDPRKMILADEAGSGHGDSDRHRHAGSCLWRG